MKDVLGFFRGARQARADLERQRARLYRIAYAWTHNAALADDLVQETLAKALAKAAQLRDPNASAAWLYSILANCHRDHFRRARATEEIEDETLTHDETPERESGRREVVREVRRAVARLSENQRQVVALVDLEGLSYVEVAQALDIPIGTVMSRLCRARANLKGLLADVLAPEATETDGRRTECTTIRRIK